MFFKEKNYSSAKTLDISDKSEILAENKSVLNRNNLAISSPAIPKSETHNLLPKHVSKLPTSTDERKTNSYFKPVTVTNALKLNQNLTSGSSPLGRIEIKSNSPIVRVGLSRNTKLPSLHKNVKPSF